jgi:Tfp pilus assembly protein PilN
LAVINLLNPEDLKQIRAARTNVRLRRYVTATAFTLVAIVGVYATGYILADNQYTKATADNRASQAELQNYAKTKDDATTYRSNLTIAKKILANEIVLSDFLVDLANTLPPNTVIDGLTLTTTKPTSASKTNTTQLKARAKTYDDVVVLKTRLEESELFSDVNIDSTITSSAENATGLGLTYPIEATFNLTIDELAGL